MSETPIGDAVHEELFPASGTTMDEFLAETAEDHDAAAAEDTSPDAHEDYALTDPDPVLNEDADDDLTTVPDGEDDGDTPLDDDPAEDGSDDLDRLGSSNA